VEEWKATVEFPEDYDISSVGRLRRTSPGKGATVGRIRKVRLLNGYPAYWIKIGGVVTVRYAHRLVADAFLGPIPAGMQVNHKDGNRACCDVANLEIVTNGENRAHAYRVLGVPPNRGPVGCDHPNAKLTWEQVCDVRKAHSDGVGSVELSHRYGISRQGIYRIVTGKVRQLA
jgi:hypothetical protein